MSRTYQTSEQYDAACDQLAAHLNTLATDEVSRIRASGWTTDRSGRTWFPAQGHLVEQGTSHEWFVEEHGAAARFKDGEWLANEVVWEALSDSGLALWGESDGDFGYPKENGQ